MMGVWTPIAFRWKRQVDQACDDLDAATQEYRNIRDITEAALADRDHTIAALRAELAAQMRLTEEARQEADYWREVCKGQMTACGILQNQHRMEP